MNVPASSFFEETEIEVKDPGADGGVCEKCKLEMKHLKEKVKLLEIQIKDKIEIIELLKKGG